MEAIEVIRLVNYLIAVLFVVCYSYQLLYIPLSLAVRAKPHKAAALHRFAVLICARNEEAVVGQLIDSIKLQDYPASLITIFTAADNCSDNTSLKARQHGAVVYERFDQKKVGKGYALDYLLGCIREDYGEDAFDGFFVFDADNLLSGSYISEMNKTFSDGFEIVTSYRNSKNFGDNWVSAGYSLWFLREAEFLNHPRMLLGTSCAVSGTGFLFSREVLKLCGGWRFFLLTEDIEFTVHNILEGRKVGYCGSAVLYDEQPTKFCQSWRQRMRWAKGYLQVFRKYGLRLLYGIFKKQGFACFDMSMAIMPAIVLTVAAIVLNISAAVLGFLGGQDLLVELQSIGESLLNAYFFLLFIGAVTTLTQWKQIHTPAAKKILYTFTFPLFMMTYIPISFTALFRRVEWKPIEHKVSLSILSMEQDAAS